MSIKEDIIKLCELCDGEESKRVRDWLESPFCPLIDEDEL